MFAPNKRPQRFDEYAGSRRFHDTDGPWNSRCLPHLTALPATLAQMELVLNVPVVDLYVLSDVVNSDAGFASQLLQLSNLDRHPEAHFVRIEDCLVDLGIDWLLAVVSQVPLTPQDNLDGF
jgi:hypothetical protein